MSTTERAAPASGNPTISAKALFEANGKWWRTEGSKVQEPGIISVEPRDLIMATNPTMARELMFLNQYVITYCSQESVHWTGVRTTQLSEAEIGGALGRASSMHPVFLARYAESLLAQKKPPCVNTMYQRFYMDMFCQSESQARAIIKNTAPLCHYELVLPGEPGEKPRVETDQKRMPVTVEMGPGYFVRPFTFALGGAETPDDIEYMYDPLSQIGAPVDLPHLVLVSKAFPAMVSSIAMPVSFLDPWNPDDTIQLAVSPVREDMQTQMCMMAILEAVSGKQYATAPAGALNTKGEDRHVSLP
jgi:hypothetical protein